MDRRGAGYIKLAGGLLVLRRPAEIVGGQGRNVLLGPAKVLEINANEVSAEFVRGATRALDLARTKRIRIAVLKEGSPSCGSKYIYDGTFTGTPVKGDGVTTALLRSAGIQVFNEEELEKADYALLKYDQQQ